MNIGDFVWNVTSGTLLRFGTITRKEIREGGWAHYCVDWHDDTQYQASVMTDEDEVRRKRMWYRVDELHHTDAYHLERSTYMHRQSCHGRKVRKNIPVC